MAGSMSRSLPVAFSTGLFLGACLATADGPGPTLSGYDSTNAYHSDYQKTKSILFGSFPDSTYPTSIDSTSASARAEPDTLALPDKNVRPSKQDSTSKAFRKYWAKVEEESGFDELRDQMRARDVKWSKIPHWYFFDSTVV